MKNKKRIAKITLLVVVLAALISYFAIPTVNSKVNQVFTLFSSMSVENIVGYIRSFGGAAVLVSFLLMVFQSVAAPLPAFLITFANAATGAGGKAPFSHGQAQWQELFSASISQELPEET